MFMITDHQKLGIQLVAILTQSVCFISSMHNFDVFSILLCFIESHCNKPNHCKTCVLLFKVFLKKIISLFFFNHTPCNTKELVNQFRSTNYGHSQVFLLVQTEFNSDRSSIYTIVWPPIPVANMFFKGLKVNDLNRNSVLIHLWSSFFFSSHYKFIYLSFHYNLGVFFLHLY